LKRPSLRLRLVFAATVSVVVALAFIGVLIANVFDRQITSRLENDLSQQLDQLAANLVIGADGAAALDANLTDPRYESPLSGLYWQIDEDGKPPLRSRSLWDVTLAIAPTQASGLPELASLVGPGDTDLVALSRDVTLRDSLGVARHFRLAVAEDSSITAAIRADLLRTLGLGLAIACLVLIVAAVAQITFGLRPLEAVRREIAVVRKGVVHHVETSGIPVEVVPLAEEINALLDLHRHNLERARRRAGDLAHGLKTPLAALAAQADMLARQNAPEAAEAIRRHLGAMHRFVERELALARSQSGAVAIGEGAKAIAEIVSIVETLKKLPAAHPLEYAVEGPSQLTLAMNAEDFAEVAGNLIDNARKWAKSRIAITVAEDDGTATVTVEDDGPGIPEDKQAEALSRGVRLDQKVVGSGLGLSIVEALLENYNSRLALARSPAGGLSASFTAPIQAT
jgi:signal transduction histidine kinase